MRKYLLAFGLLALAAPAVLAAFDETEHVTRTIQMAPGGTLRLKSFSGRVNITTSDRPEVTIAAVRHGTRDRLDRVKLDIHTEGSNVLSVDANHHDRSWSWFEFTGRNSVVDTDFDIKVPRRTNLNISVFSAPVTVDGVEGSHTVHSFSSRLSLSDVAGPIRVHSRIGSIATQLDQ